MSLPSRLCTGRRGLLSTPSGLKGVGEAGCIPTGALFAQAVDDALADFGVEITEIPLSPNRLFELIEQAKARSK